MAAESQGPGAPEQHRVGEHWGTANPIPKIQEFMSSVDSEKRERNRKIDEEVREKREQHIPEHQEGEAPEQGRPQDDEALPHRQREVSKRKTRTATDPTTGKEIEVEDQDEESMEAVKNNTVFPTCSIQREISANGFLQVVVPNANLGKETVSVVALRPPTGLTAI